MTPERQRNIDGLIRNASAPAQPESAERKPVGLEKDKEGRSSVIDALKFLAENRDGSGEERKSKPVSKLSFGDPSTLIRSLSLTLLHHSADLDQDLG